jgi:hypothetical protein
MQPLRTTLVYVVVSTLVINYSVSGGCLIAVPDHETERERESDMMIDVCRLAEEGTHAMLSYGH